MAERVPAIKVLLLPKDTNAYGTIFGGQYLDRDAIAFLFLIAVLLVRPRGLGGVVAA